MTPSLISSIDIEILKAAQIRGEFPTSLNLLTKVSERIDSHIATTTEISNDIAADLVLALRLISISNFEYYRKDKQVKTVPQAVNHLGLAKVRELLMDLSEAKNFNAIHLKRSTAAIIMQQVIIAASLAKRAAKIIAPQKNYDDEAYVVAALINLAPLLLAFYKPNIYSGLALDCSDDRGYFEQAFRKVMRKSLGEFAGSFITALSLPEEYQAIVLMLDEPPWHRKNWGKVDRERTQAIVTAVYIANLIAHEICFFTGVQGIQALIRELDLHTAIKQSELEDLIGTVGDGYIEHTETLALKPLRLPEYLLWFSSSRSDSKPPLWRSALPGISERINPFLYELRECFKQRPVLNDFFYFPQAMHCTLNALMKGLNFDRAIFFSVDESKRFLQLNICMGVKLFQPSKIRRPLDPDTERNLSGELPPDIVAYTQRTAVFQGEPIFSDGWPFVTFPAIWRDQVIGIFYADKVRRPDNDALDTQEQISCVALAEEWHDIPEDFC